MADDSLCEALDELTLEFFDKFEHLQSKREEICKTMRDGYLNLSQARYSMGNKSVCSLQYSETMKASTLVNMAGADVFEIIKHKPTAKQEDKSPEESSTALRKRKGNKESGNESTDVKMEDIVVENSPKEKQATQNPLKWFGVLVPMCLRTGQAQFKTAIDLCCELVNLENEIKALIQSYQAQKHLKMKRGKK